MGVTRGAGDPQMDMRKHQVPCSYMPADDHHQAAVALGWG